MSLWLSSITQIKFKLKVTWIYTVEEHKRTRQVGSIGLLTATGALEEVNACTGTEWLLTLNQVRFSLFESRAAKLFWPQSVAFILLNNLQLNQLTVHYIKTLMCINIWSSEPIISYHTFKYYTGYWISVILKPCCSHWLCLGVHGSFSDTDIDFLFWASLIFKFCSLFLMKYRIVYIYFVYFTSPLSSICAQPVCWVWIWVFSPSVSYMLCCWFL